MWLAAQRRWVRKDEESSRIGGESDTFPEYANLYHFAFWNYSNVLHIQKN